MYDLSAEEKKSENLAQEIEEEHIERMSPFAFSKCNIPIGTDIVYVIRIDEGSEPPYITNSGKIYERLSSGSFVVKDSSKLSQIYNKREQLLVKMERKISIPPVYENTNNIYGYIDSGFCLVVSDIQVAIDTFNSANLETIAKEAAKLTSSFSLSHIGNSIVFTHGGYQHRKGIYQRTLIISLR